MHRPLALTLALAFAAVSVAARPASAQPAVDARLSVALDALDPGAFASETRGTVEGSVAPELRFASQHGRLYYRLDGGSFNTPGDWSFLSHALGVTYRLDLGSAEKAQVFVGGAGSWRRNGEAWSEADHDARSAFVNLELRPRPGLTLRTGYALADRTFAQLTELDQFEQDTFASLNLNLQSRTTLIAESHFGWKSYQGETRYDLIPAPLAPSAPLSPGQGENGAGGGRGVRASLPGFIATGNASEHARQWNTLLRVAQGLGERTGAWAQGFVRRTAGGVPPAIVITPAGFFDDGVYDDPFASDLSALSAGVKHIFAGGADLRATSSWQRKEFTAVPALDGGGAPFPGNPLRTDRITRAGLGLSLPLADPDAFSLALALDYGFTNSRSNDAFYDYRDHAVGLSLTLRR